MHAVQPSAGIADRGQGDAAPYAESPPPAAALPELTRSDVRMTIQALANNWAPDQARRARIIDVLCLVALHPGRYGAKTSVAAARAVIAADRVNLEVERSAPNLPVLTTDAAGRERLDFSGMTDDDLTAYIEGRGTRRGT